MRLVYKVLHNLNKLHEELLAFVSAIQPIPNGQGEREAVFTISGDGETIYLDVPDDLTPEQVAEIERVVNAHDPS